MFPYQRTALLLQVKEDTGIPIEVDDKLEPMEMEMVPLDPDLGEDSEIKIVRISPHTIFESCRQLLLYSKQLLILLHSDSSYWKGSVVG